jgi:hypothetical protein
MRETWPEPAVQWAAAAGAPAHVGILWTAIRRASPARRTAAAVLVGGVPFLVLQIGLAAASRRYGGDTAGFILGACGVAAVLAASAILISAAVSKETVHTCTN